MDAVERAICAVFDEGANSSEAAPEISETKSEWWAIFIPFTLNAERAGRRRGM